jgi:hypothetical protein
MSPGSRSILFSAQRFSTTMFWPSTQPNSRRRPQNSSVPRKSLEDEFGLTKPTRTTLCEDSAARADAIPTAATAKTMTSRIEPV